MSASFDICPSGNDGAAAIADAPAVTDPAAVADSSTRTPTTIPTYALLTVSRLDFSWHRPVNQKPGFSQMPGFFCFCLIAFAETNTTYRLAAREPVFC
jgi:hypothetical protein